MSVKYETVPVPEPSTIGGIAVTSGLLGIWLKKKKVISLKE
ncbi:PEP-CTERM sorting domain-containing protein [Nostoc sp. CALU 1950]